VAGSSRACPCSRSVNRSLGEPGRPGPVGAFSIREISQSREKARTRRVESPVGKIDRGFPRIPVAPQISAPVAADLQKSDLDHLLTLQIA